MQEASHLAELVSQLKIVKDRVRSVINKSTTGFYLYGRPGTSKTYTVRKTLETLHCPFSYSNGHITPRALFDLIRDNRDRIIILDDISSIFNKPEAMQILLAALGSPHDESNTRYVTYHTAKEHIDVPFSGGIVAISNLPLEGHHHAILRALGDRIQVVNYEPSDLAKKEEIEVELRIALEVHTCFTGRKERLAEWQKRTNGMSQSTFYRRIGDLKTSGRLKDEKNKRIA